MFFSLDAFESLKNILFRFFFATVIKRRPATVDCFYVYTVRISHNEGFAKDRERKYTYKVLNKAGYTAPASRTVGQGQFCKKNLKFKM